MIAKLFTIFTTVLIINSGFAQKCDYIDYYHLVTTAAAQYADKDYKAAEKTFKLAFSKNVFPLGADLDLALKIAQRKKDSKWAEQLAIQLAKGGVPFRYFFRQKGFDWYETFKTNFKTYSDYYEENFHPELRSEVVSLLKKDKETTSQYHDWRTRKIEMTLQELIDGASKMSSSFKKLTDAYGFPNERLMGYNYNRRKNSVEYYVTAAIVIHIYQMGELIFENEIGEIVCQGGLHPNYVDTLKKIRGLGNSSGIEQEMKARYKHFRPEQ